jgi:hypothetical protein
MKQIPFSVQATQTRSRAAICGRSSSKSNNKDKVTKGSYLCKSLLGTVEPKINVGLDKTKVVVFQSGGILFTEEK